MSSACLTIETYKQCASDIAAVFDASRIGGAQKGFDADLIFREDLL